MDTPDKQKKGSAEAGKNKAKSVVKLNASGHQSFENPLTDE